MMGKAIRMERIMDRDTGNFVIVPVDHGISIGPVKGLVDMRKTIDTASAGGATAVVMHKGIVPHGHRRFGGDIGLILHLSASTSLCPDPNAKVLVASVTEGLKMGVDAVSIHMNIGTETEPQMIADMGLVARECAEWGVPLMAMIYPRGPEIKDPFDVDLVKHVARVAAELGADIVKTNYTGDIDTFREVTRGALVPVVIAGGPKIDSDEELLIMVRDSIEAGGRGVSIGRNVFQHHDPLGITRAVSAVVMEGMDVEEALNLIGR